MATLQGFSLSKDSNVVIKFLRHRKYKKMIKASSSFILEELAKVSTDTISHFEEEGLIEASLRREVLKFESTALLFWLFQKSTIFPELVHKLILDEIHHQYYTSLRKHSYDSNMRQGIANDFNLRYRTYNKSFSGDDNDMLKIGFDFISFVNKRANVDSGSKGMLIPMYLIEKVKPKFQEFSKVTS